MNHPNSIAVDRLRSFLERVERLEASKLDLAADIKEVFAEAKGEGYDPKIMRSVIKLRKLPAEERQEIEYLLETYKSALGMGQMELPLASEI